jgi:hypothetical protein
MDANASREGSLGRNGELRFGPSESAAGAPRSAELDGMVSSRVIWFRCRVTRPDRFLAESAHRSQPGISRRPPSPTSRERRNGCSAAQS